MDLPPPIQRFIETTNRADSSGFLACFTADAALSDSGRRYHGSDGIASWNETDNIGAKAQMEVLHAKSTDRGFEVVVRVTSNNFNGQGAIVFQLDGERIARVTIE